jgi:hypothetical protein
MVMDRESLKTVFFMALVGLLLAACSPRVITEVTMNYPARSVDEVRVYDVGDTVPNSAVTIGKVAVLDRGFTTNCGYDRMLGLAKERTAENGGNGLLLTEHKKPGFWGSSCHQLMGMMFLMSDSIVDANKPNAVMDDATRYTEKVEQDITDRAIYANSIRLSAGYGSITSDVETFRGVKHPRGLEVTLDYEHCWSSGWGIGANTAMFFSSYSEASDGINGNLSLFYIGPSVVAAFKFHKHWGMGTNLGLGYAYVDDVFFQQSGIGFMGKIRAEYFLNDNWGLGLDWDVFASRFKKPNGVVLPDNKKWGFTRISFMLGVRYYF